ncbi:peptidyl-prolyl cis-trans isomerase [Lysobacter yangpyeongensis]|uniref:peptidylprolyl isomerase n=1 Tax=Lysobacter yangpyeongensis TaxID=346182 RepID=A0ABW0SJ33_9GAMM
MTHSERARGWRDPLIQFLLIGALLFVADHAFGTGASSARRIVLGSSDIGQLKQIYLQQWQREPDAQQLQALIEARVREEILYREAVARGLDQDDVIVRRRLAQKMDYLAQQDIAAPTDDELRAWLRAHRDRYSEPATYDIEQVYFGEGEQGRARAANALPALLDGRDVAGAASMLPRLQPGVDGEQLAQRYGNAFAEAVSTAKQMQWTGPVESAIGFHLLRVTATQRKVPDFDELRDRLRNDVSRERMDAARDRAYAELRAQYQVRVDGRMQPPVAP